MKYNPKIHHRQSIRLKNYDYSQNGLYFITICSQDLQHMFGEIMDAKMVLNDAGKMIQTQWLVLPERFANIKLHQYTAMPNHFHAIMEIVGAPLVGAQISMGQPKEGLCQKGQSIEGQPQGIAPTVGNIVGAFKSISTNEYIRGVKQNDWQRFNKKLWQRNYWEHIIRNENEHLKISQYIIDNPAKWQDDKLNGGMGNQVMESQAIYGEEIWMI